jgi:hypothetical protein
MGAQRYDPQQPGWPQPTWEPIPVLGGRYWLREMVLGDEHGHLCISHCPDWLKLNWPDSPGRRPPT